MKYPYAFPHREEEEEEKESSSRSKTICKELLIMATGAALGSGLLPLGASILATRHPPYHAFTGVVGARAGAIGGALMTPTRANGPIPLFRIRRDNSLLVALGKRFLSALTGTALSAAGYAAANEGQGVPQMLASNTTGAAMLCLAYCLLLLGCFCAVTLKVLGRFSRESESFPSLIRRLR